MKGSCCARICLRRSASWSCPSVPRCPRRDDGNCKSQKTWKRGKISPKEWAQHIKSLPSCFPPPASIQKRLCHGSRLVQAAEHRVGYSSWGIPSVLWSHHWQNRSHITCVHTGSSSSARLSPASYWRSPIKTSAYTRPLEITVICRDPEEKTLILDDPQHGDLPEGTQNIWSSWVLHLGCWVFSQHRRQPVPYCRGTHTPVLEEALLIDAVSKTNASLHPSTELPGSCPQRIQHNSGHVAASINPAQRMPDPPTATASHGEASMLLSLTLVLFSYSVPSAVPRLWRSAQDGYLSGQVSYPH